MSFRPGLFQNAFKAAFPRQTLHRTFHSPQLKTIAVKRPNAISFLFPLTLGTCYMTYHSTRQPVRCDSSILNSLSTGPVPTVGDGQTEPHSSLSGYQLGFGAICGICAGVFVKKGLKALAFILGGAFVFMQYLSSKKFISVDWSKVAGSYDSTFGTKGPKGQVRAPTVGGVWDWFVDFVTANFQQRATFLAGFALGIRLG